MRKAPQKGARPLPAALSLPPGMIALSVLPDHLPVAVLHPAEFTDIQAGDILLVTPDEAGQYVAEHDGRPVIVGTVRGYVRGDGIKARPSEAKGDASCE